MTEIHPLADSNPELPAGISLAAEHVAAVRDELAALPSESKLPIEARRHQADQLLLDALLTQVLNPAEKARREELIRRLMQSTHQETAAPAPTVKSRRAWLTTLASLAALVVLGLLFLSPAAGPKTALAAVERSLEATAADVDRQYRIQMTKPRGAALLPVTLTVHGSRKFVWEQPVVLGTLRVGSNGEDYWMVPTVGPVVVAEEGSLLERLLSEKQVTTPILTLATALEWLRDRYALELLPEEDLPQVDTPDGRVRCQHIRGQLRTADMVLKPQHLEIWCDRRTGVVQQMTADWPATEKLGPLRVEVRLQASPGELPADWYDHASHHAKNRRVIRRPPP